ncbi:MAG TPA: hypothetical protein VD907_06260 [Verrucomicrobiae bacterium]|nr:hypothetical protein [Verrucomicrobiae bacterium]
MKALVISDVSVETAGMTKIRMSVEQLPGKWVTRELFIVHDHPLRLQKGTEVELRYVDAGDPGKGYDIFIE